MILGFFCSLWKMIHKCEVCSLNNLICSVSACDPWLHSSEHFVSKLFGSFGVKCKRELWASENWQSLLFYFMFLDLSLTASAVLIYNLCNDFIWESGSGSFHSIDVLKPFLLWTEWKSLAKILVVSSAKENSSTLVPLMLMTELKQEMSTLCAPLSSYRDQRLENYQKIHSLVFSHCCYLFSDQYIAFRSILWVRGYLV